MVQISRIFLRRVPSITFPVRMIDGVRVTGVVASTSSSGKKNVVDERFSTKKASSSSSFSKAPPVVVSEEECEIVNVSVSLMIVVVVSCRSSLSFCSRASSSSSSSSRERIPLLQSTRSYSSPSLSLSLTHENAHEFILSLSLRCSAYYRWADTGPIWTRTSTTARRLRLPNNCNTNKSNTLKQQYLKRYPLLLFTSRARTNRPIDRSIDRQ